MSGKPHFYLLVTLQVAKTKALTRKRKKRKKENKEKRKGGFPGGAVVRDLPANAGDMGSSADPGRSPMPRSN